MTLALQDDHLFAGAWAACGETSYSHRADFERNRLKKKGNQRYILCSPSERLYRITKLWRFSYVVIHRLEQSLI